MDTYLIPSCITLIATNISFALLANHWRRQAKQYKREVMVVELAADETYRQEYARGYDDGERGATGKLYRAALRAERQGADIVEALRVAGRGLEEPIVQVPAQV